MKLKSLGHRSQLIFTEFDGKAEDHGDHWAMRTISNPNFFWGNLLIFDRPPIKGDFHRWVATFRKEFTNPLIYHMTLAWDSLNGEVGDIKEFLENGFQLESTAVLTATKVVRPSKFNPQVKVEIITTPDHWEQMIEMQILSAHDHLSRNEWESFYRKQAERYQDMIKAGFGNWYGAFIGDTLVGGLGIFHRNRLGRFQTVCTHPKYLRQGICQTLVFQASQHAFTSGQVEELVICADPEYHALKIYEHVGFERRQVENGVYWWDKTKNP